MVRITDHDQPTRNADATTVEIPSAVAPLWAWGRSRAVGTEAEKISSIELHKALEALFEPSETPAATHVARQAP